MTAQAIHIPSALGARLGANEQTALFGVGPPALLAEPLLGFIASRECPGHIHPGPRAAMGARRPRCRQRLPLPARTTGADLAAAPRRPRRKGADARPGQRRLNARHGLFCGSDLAGQRAAIVMSLVQVRQALWQRLACLQWKSLLGALCAMRPSSGVRSSRRPAMRLRTSPSRCQIP